MDDDAVVIGVDAHKRTHTLVAADALGRKLGEKTLAATTDGHMAAVEWAARWPRRRWAVEDWRHLTRRLESDLLRAGEQLVRVPTKLMAESRRTARDRASLTRSTRSRSRGRRGASRTSRRRAWTGDSVR